MPSSGLALAMGSQHGADRKHARELMHGVFAGLPQGFGGGAACRIDFDGETDVTASQRQSCDQSGFDNALL